jgi:hypothetical protein
MRILYNWHTDESRKFDIRLVNESRKFDIRLVNELVNVLGNSGFNENNINFLPLRINKTKYRLIIRVNGNKYYVNEYDDLSDKTFNEFLSGVICFF